MVRQFKPKQDRLVVIVRNYEYRGHGMAVLLNECRLTYQVAVETYSTDWILADVVEYGLLRTNGRVQVEDAYLGELSCVETKLSRAPELGPPGIQQGFSGIDIHFSPSLHGFPEVIHSIGDEITCPLHIQDSLLTLLKPETRCLAFALVLPSREPGACLPPPIPGTFRHLQALQNSYWSPFAAAFHKIHPDAKHFASQLKVGVYVALYELADGPTPKRVEERDPLEVMLLPSTTVATVVSLVLQATAMDWAVEDVWVQARHPIPDSAAMSRPVLLDALFPRFVDIQAGTGEFHIHQRLAYADSPVVRDGAMAVAMIGPSKDRRSLPPTMPGSSPTYTHCNSRHSTLWEPMKSISVAWRGRSATRYKRNLDE